VSKYTINIGYKLLIYNINILNYSFYILKEKIRPKAKKAKFKY
jgi:hypothetical protein